MNTFLSASEEALMEQYRIFAREKVQPVARELESHKLSLKEFLQEIGQSGCLGVTVPQEFGGQGCKFFNLALLVQAISEYEPGLGLSIAEHTAAIELIKQYGSQAQKSRYLPLLSRGDVVASLAFSEVNAGSDFEAVTTVALKDGGNYILSGKKTWVVNAELAGLLIVLAKAVASKEEQDGELMLLVVDVDSTSGLKVSADKVKLGLRSALSNDLEFDQLVVPADSKLESTVSTKEQVLFAMDIAKVIVSAAAVGLTVAALGQSVSHARSREQFGKEIGQNQAIQWKLADHGTEAEAAKLHTYRAAWSKDENPGEFRKYAAMSKWFAAKVARTHSGEALQVLGAAGISCDSDLERFYRDAKVMEICEGTSEFQKVLLVKELEI